MKTITDPKVQSEEHFNDALRVKIDVRNTTSTLFSSRSQGVVQQASSCNNLASTGRPRQTGQAGLQKPEGDSDDDGVENHLQMAKDIKEDKRNFCFEHLS